MKSNRPLHTIAFVGLTVIFAGLPQLSHAGIPYFARKYHVTCARCHIGFPKLNAFGKNFQLHGYQQPGDKDVGRVKTSEDPNLSLLDQLPAAVLIENSLQFDNRVGSDNPFNIQSPDAFHLLFGGSIAQDIGMFAEVESSDEGTGLAKVEVTLNHLGNQNIHLQVGKLDPMEHGITQHDLFTRSNYAIYEMGLGGFNLGDENRGIRLYGLINSSVSPALIHGGPATGQETPADTTAPPPPAHGPAVLTPAKQDQGDQEEPEPVDPMDQLKGGLWEIGLFNGSGDAVGKDAKDVMGRFNVYFDNDSFVGVYGYSGRTVVGDPVTGVDNNHHLMGADFSVMLGKAFEKSPGVMQKPFNLMGGFVSGSDDNPMGDGTKVNWNGQFIEGDYIIGSRSIFLVRYDKIDSKNLADIRRDLITANYTYFLKTNFEVGLEYTHDMKNTRLNGLSLNFNFAF